METKEIQKTVESILEAVKKQRKAMDYYGLLTSGIACIEYSYRLIDIMVEAENKYRKLEASLLSDNSQAKAQTIAKASDEYKEWTKTKFMYDTLLELNMTCKKLSGDNNKELKAI